MKPTTTLPRVALALLAGALAAPLFVVFLMQLADPYAWTLDATIDFLKSLPLILPLSILIGGPIALVSILILFGPLWLAHHRNGGGVKTFILAGSAAGFVMACPLALFTNGGSLTNGLRLLLIFTLAAIPTTALLWRVAYGPLRREKALPPGGSSSGEVAG